MKRASRLAAASARMGARLVGIALLIAAIVVVLVVSAGGELPDERVLVPAELVNARR